MRTKMNLITIESLKDFPEKLENFFYAIPESAWQWYPESWEGIPSESLSALEQICHIRDVEIDGYHIRFQRILDEIEPSLDSLDGYTLVKENKYAQSTPADVFMDIKLARLTTLKLIEDLTESQLLRKGYLEGYGKLTLKGLIHYLCSHDQQHLSGLQWLLGKIESKK